MSEISIGRLRGGFCVYWTEDGQRRRHQLKARTRKDAEAEAIDTYRRKRARHTSQPTVADIWADYARSLEGRPTGKTLQYTGKAVLEHFGHFRPNQLSHDLCKDFARSRTASQGTIHTELGHLQSAMNYGAKTGQIDRAPYIWRPEKPSPKERYLTHTEIAHLIDAASAPHIRLAIVLLLGTAGRVGAILDLEWNRVDFETGQINLRLPDAATRKGRAVVPMNGMTRAALTAAHEAALSDFVIEYAAGPVKSIRKGFANACERAGLHDVTIHTLRHTAAVHMVQAGIPMTKVSQYLGHSNSATTERVYARFAPDHLSDAAEVLNFTTIRNHGR